jgi:hypothetical protein
VTSPLQTDQLMRLPAYIPGLPEPLRVVPSDPHKWRLWAESIRAYREKRRRDCARDVRQQQIEKERCRRSTTYFITVWGVIFEARSVEGGPPAWKPFILFPFQVHMVDWIEYTLTLDPDAANGRGDGIIEKSRDMGATNIFCGVAVKHFLFDDVFVCGFQSRRFDDVDNKTKTGTIFYRIRALLGVEDSVPPSLRLPRFLQPAGFDPVSHSLPGQGAIKNPEPGKTCVLVGETTTKLSSVSDRFTMRLSDEAARYPEFSQAWANQQAVTDHRYANSTADSDYGDAFYNMARLGEECLIDPSRPGPAYLRLEWHLHPFHTPEWMAGQEARARSNANYEDFAREYKIEYFAQRGSLVYPLYKQVNPGHYPYDPNGGPIMCWIDPGISDPGAIVWAQQDYGRGGWNIIESFEGKGGEDAHFYASILTGVYVSGEYSYDYSEYERLHEIMEFTGSCELPITYIGDPAGTARGARGDDKSTWYQELSIGASKFSPTKRVFVNTITSDNARSHLVRQDAVRFMMPMFRFHNGPGGARVLHCLKVSRFKKTQSGRSITEPTKPEHGPESHIRTAVEYGAVWIRRMVLAKNERVVQGSRKPVRVSLSGNIVSGRQREMFNRDRRKAGLGPI